MDVGSNGKDYFSDLVDSIEELDEHNGYTEELIENDSKVKGFKPKEKYVCAGTSLHRSQNALNKAVMQKRGTNKQNESDQLQKVVEKPKKRKRAQKKVVANLVQSPASIQSIQESLTSGTSITTPINYGHLQSSLTYEPMYSTDMVYQQETSNNHSFTQMLHPYLMPEAIRSNHEPDLSLGRSYQEHLFPISNSQQDSCKDPS